MFIFQILTFTALSIISLVTGVIILQLLRLGLSDDKVASKCYDALVAAIVITSMECLVCVISAFTSCRLAKAKKKEIEEKYRQKALDKVTAIILAHL